MNKASLPLQVCRLISVLLLTFLVGCIPIPDTDKTLSKMVIDSGRHRNNTSRLNIFLNLEEDRGPAIRLEISSIEVFSNDYWMQFISGPLTIDSASIDSGQLFLGGVEMEPGNYQKLRFRVTSGELRNTVGKYEVITPEPFYVEVNLGDVLSLAPGDSSTLLITWDVKGSLDIDNSLIPHLTVIPSLIQMHLDLLFVTCPSIDTIFVIRTDKNWVVDSIGLKGGPTYLALDPDDRQLLYVLTVRDRMIKAVDLSSHKVINFFPVPLSDDPTFMTINTQIREAFLLDNQNGYINRVDLLTGQILARVLVGNEPNYAVYLEEHNLLAVSLSRSQNVLLLDPESLRVLRTISTGMNPSGIAALGNQLYMAEYEENSISIANLNDNRRLSRLEVGFGPRRIGVNDNQIYVINYQDGSISILEPGQLGVNQEIYGMGSPLEMDFDQNYNRLYITDIDKKALVVIDTRLNNLMGHIFLGAPPFALDITQ